MVVTDAGSAAAYNSFTDEVVQDISRDISTAGISLQVYFANGKWSFGS